MCADIYSTSVDANRKGIPREGSQRRIIVGGDRKGIPDNVQS